MNSKSINLLLIEDDEDDIFITKHLLDEAEQHDFSVTTAGTLKEAFSNMNESTPDVILLDLSLPDSQGRETLDAVLARSTKIPVILLTGLADKKLSLQAVQEGAQDYLFKGRIDREQLSRSIHYAIERKNYEIRLKEYRDELEKRVNDRTKELLETNQKLSDEINTRKQAEKKTTDAKNYLESVISTSQDGILVFNNSGEFEFVNKATAEILGWPREELIGHEFIKVLPEDMIEFTIERWKEVMRGEGKPHEIDILTKTGERRSLAVSHQRMTLDGNYKSCVVLRDITDHIIRDKKIQEANKKLREHDRSRSDFVFNVSHELKTPLASMSYAIDNMLKGIVCDLPDPALKYIEMLKEDTQRMAQTVGDILDLSRIESNSFKLDKVKIPISRLVGRAVKSLHLQATENRLTLTLDSDSTLGFCECDPRKIERVIINIIRNSVKFTPPNGTINVKIGVKDDNSNMFHISVIDSGMGIPSEYIDKVTERYFRVGEHVDGTGLGLAISKDILTLHGGDLQILSPPLSHETGTQVNLYIPKSKPPTAIAVDDDELTADLIRRQLVDNNYITTICKNGAEAIACLKENVPDIILTDLVMPVLGGVEMIAEIKLNSEWRHIPIIAVTGGALSLAKREILEGFDIPALAKPYKCNDLLDLIETTVFGMHYLNQE